MSTPILSVVLINPDIPQNTGNIGRLCFVTGCELVLVRPLGFRLQDEFLLRAGMDYWRMLLPTILDSFEDFQTWGERKRMFYLSAHGEKNYASVRYQRGDVFCFGSESLGFPKALLDFASKEGSLLTLPMIQGVRSLNVSSAAAAMVYEALRQIHCWGKDLYKE